MYASMNDDDPIPFFSPPLKYNSTELVDKDPVVIISKSHWALPKDGPNIKTSCVDADQAPPKRLVRRVELQQRGNSTSFDNNWIMSGSKHHSARMLCESAASVGPDFTSLDEQMFCDMEHKKTWPLCEAKKTHGSFKTASNKVIAGNGAGKGTVYDVGKMVVNDALGVTNSYS